MLAQRLRHQIVIEQKTTTLDAYGGNSAAWTTFAPVRAGVEPVSGSEMIKSGANIAEGIVKFPIRYLAGVTEQMRVVYDGRVYDIQSIVNAKTRDRMLELMCKVGQA